MSGIAKSLGHDTSIFDVGKFDDDYVISYVEKKENAGFFIPVEHINEKKERKISSHEGIIAKIIEFKPDIIAFSLMSGEHIIAKKITSSIKSKFPKIPIIWGGIHPTVDPEGCIKSGADYICIGEGLIAFKNFLTSMEKSGSVTTGNNIISTKDLNVNIELVKNNLLPLEMELDKLPYLDWSIFDESDFVKGLSDFLNDSGEKRTRIGEYMINWGCPNRCTYCFNYSYRKMYGKNYKLRSYSPERVIAELKYLKDHYNIEVFRFFDDDFFLLSERYMREFCALYVKHINIPYIVNGFANTITEEKVRLLKNSGCGEVGIGIENGDEEYRKAILGRTDTLNKIKNACKLLKKYQIRIFTFNLIATPYYTRELHEKTISINREINPDIANLSFFTPFLETELRQLAIEDGSYDPSKDDIVENYNFLSPSLVFKNLSKKDLLTMYNLFSLYVKLPEESFKYLKFIEDNDIRGEIMREKLLLIYQKEKKRIGNRTGMKIEISKENFQELDKIIKET